MPAPTCATELAKLYDAYMALVAGDKETTVTFGDRSATFSQANLAALKDLYMMFWRQCGAAEGYPNINAGGAERGPPAIIRF